MSGLRYLTVVLAVVVVAESAFIALPLLRTGDHVVDMKPAGSPETHILGYSAFNQPISNDTDLRLGQSYAGSWEFTVSNTLVPGSPSSRSEAQVALAPAYSSENLSIPTLIVQERADGLLRIEYFAQNWPNTYGLVLYNSTEPSWRGGLSVTLRFVQFGSPSEINPAIAPRPNGNLSISVGGEKVVTDFMIAWASLGELYVYGTAGSSFVGGAASVSVQGLSGS